jgi:hypothetical protein
MSNEQLAREKGYFIMVRPWLFVGIAAVEVTGTPIFGVLDEDISRIIRAYQLSFADFNTKENSLWNSIIFSKQSTQHDAFMRGDVPAVRNALEDPASNNLLYGFDEVFAEFMTVFSARAEAREGYGHCCMDRLIALATALGRYRAFNPEHQAWATIFSDAPDRLIDEIEGSLCQSVDFPAIFKRYWPSNQTWRSRGPRGPFDLPCTFAAWDDAEEGAVHLRDWRRPWSLSLL